MMLQTSRSLLPFLLLSRGLVESAGRVHTSAITVAVMPEAEEVDFEINPADLRIDTFKASGKG